MTIIRRAATLLATLLLFTPALAAAANLISNPNLETQSGSVPSQWVKTYWGTVTPTFKYPDVGNNSSKGASITLSRDTGGDARWMHALVTVEPGATYAFSSWYKSNAATEINAEYRTTAGQASYGWIANVPSSNNTWKQITANVTIPADVTKISVYHLIDKKGTLTVDDFSLEKAGTPNPTPGPGPTPVPGAFSEGMVSFTFDDSWLSQYTNAFPLLQAAGIKGTFYITTQPLQELWDGFMIPSQVKDIFKSGHEIGGHTVTHADLTTLNQSGINREIKNSKTYIERLIGSTITTLAYPYGAYNATVRTLTKNAGYTTGRATDEGLNVKTTDKYALKSECPVNTTPFSQIKQAIDDAKQNKQWYILCLHEVNDTGDEYSITPARLKEIIDYVKTSNIKIVTVKEGTTLMAN